MTFEQTVTFTALPNGIAPDGRLKVSVFIAPRLITDQEGGVTLADFPDFENFSNLAQSTSFQFVLDAHAPIAAVVDPAMPQPDNYLWSTIFPSDCPVTPFTDDSIDTYGDRTIRSYPAANIAKFASNLYAEFGLTSPTAYPSTGALLSNSVLGQFANDPAPPIDSDRGPLAGLLQQLDMNIAAAGGVLPPEPYNPANIGLDMAQVYKFHEPPPIPSIVNDTPVPEFDFHQGLGSLGSHPGLLRQLGIIRDLFVTLPAGYTLGHAGTVAVIPVWTPQFAVYHGGPVHSNNSTIVISAKTVYNGDYGFITQPTYTNPKLDRRRLRLNNPIYSVVDFDIDGAALKAMALANTVAHELHTASASTPGTEPLPAMRTEGLVLLETGLAATTQADLARQQDLHETYLSAGAAPTLFAEDVLRGYHIDVWDDTAQRWSPLCGRHVTYSSMISNTEVGPGLDVEDEGIVTLAVTSHVPSDTNPTPDIRIPETLAKWSGWSLVAPRIGSFLDGEDNSLKPNYDPTAAIDDTSGDGVTPATITPIKLGIVTTIPQDPTRPKLPSLRFGRQYKFRARAVDLAGNADLFLAQETTTETTPLAPFSRYETVNPPVVLLHDDPTPSESVKRLVIRSNYNTPVVEPSIRHLAPPNGSQLLAEHSGFLDSGGRVDANLYAQIAALDGQKFDSSPLNAKHPDPSSPPPSAANTSTGQQVFTDDYVVCPYLIDSFSRGVAAYGLPFGLTTVGGQAIPGGNASMGWFFAPHQVPTGTFPMVQGNRLRLTEGTTSAYQATVSVNSAGNSELVVPLTKGSVVTVRLSSFLTPDTSAGTSADINRMGLWNLLSKGADGSGLSSADTKNYRALIAAGLHVMFTPYEQITLVHAVQQPLLEPTFMTVTTKRKDLNGTLVSGTYATLDSSRNHGETVAYLSGSIKVSGRSTAKVQFIADWTEQQDNLAQPGPSTPAYSARPYALGVNSANYPIADPKTGLPLAPSADEIDISVTADSAGHYSGPFVQDFHDHKHRMVNYTIEAISAFAEEFVETTTQTITSLPQTIEVSSSSLDLVGGYTRIVAPDGTVYVEGPDFTINYPSSGQISFPSTSSVAIGLPLTIEYLQLEISRFSTETGNGTTAPQQTAVVNIPATARPIPPGIEYVVPAYKWAGWMSTSRTTSTNKRAGNTLRVYLARPWFSSGDNEKLAVICPTGTAQPDAQDAANLHSIVSLIGADPIWGTSSWTPEDTKTLKPSGPVQAILTPSNFPLATTTITSGVPLAGTTGVGVAVHEVAYDADRQLWYSDIQITPKAGAYTPFVRLALARYQANALQDGSGDYRLSSVATAEISQLGPDRALTMVTSATGINATITGTSYLSTGEWGNNLVESSRQYQPAKPGPSVMICKVQTIVPGMNPLAYPDTAWQDYPNDPTIATQTMTRSITSQGVATWKLAPRLPSAWNPQTMRLAFIEHELVNSLSTTGRVVFAATFPPPTTGA